MTHGPVSVQWDHATKSVKGSEDCLYLNVYTRNADHGSRAPVMVWIHGGAFTYGNGNDDEFGPDYLLQQDVVLVTLNYRLGIFGKLDEWMKKFISEERTSQWKSIRFSDRSVHNII